MPARKRRPKSSVGIALPGVWWASTRRRFVRILFVNEKCGYFGGIEQNVADTAAGLRERGHQCFLAYRETTGRQDSGYQANFEECVHADQLDHAVAHVRPDVIYIHKANVMSLGT